jgi:hypothetical protein
MDPLEVFTGIGAILIMLLAGLDMLGDLQELRRRERAQREVQRRHDQYLADAREMTRQAEEQRIRRKELGP